MRELEGHESERCYGESQDQYAADERYDAHCPMRRYFK